jgi:hypothetical protein
MPDAGPFRAELRTPAIAAAAISRRAAGEDKYMNDEPTELRDRVRAVLAEWGPEDAVTVLPPASTRPGAVVLEIRPAPLEDYPLPARLERMTRLLRAGGLEHRAVAGGEPEVRGIEIAQLIQLLRDRGINATADFDADTAVVSVGPPPQVNMDRVRAFLAKEYGPAMPPVTEAMVLTVWAGIPPEDV